VKPRNRQHRRCPLCFKDTLLKKNGKVRSHIHPKLGRRCPAAGTEWDLATKAARLMHLMTEENRPKLEVSGTQTGRWYSNWDGSGFRYKK